ncbi:YdcF family protein [Deinococcus sp. Marseille-Q6407]|uniref:YdcF family protein n=1 Tax=Deinococcus sp. Marseille-Q6407 TaxID=2969223 RepID=UPI0021C12954|nr:YdcF family protein [Deinococcus sp. Marseille-Q6407]
MSAPDPLPPDLPARSRSALRPGYLWSWLGAGLAAGVLLSSLLILVGYGPFGALALPLTGLGALLGLWRPGRWLLRALLGAAALVYAAALFTPLVPHAMAALTEAQAPAPADAIIVLGGGLNCAEGTPAPASAARLSRGIDLWRAGYAETLVLSSQSDVLSPASCPRLSDLEAAQLRRWFAVPPRLLTLQNVTDTADEARQAAGLEAQHGWKRVLLVTSPSHSARAAALFRRELKAEVLSVPAEEWSFSPSGLTAYDRLRGLNVVLYESLSRVKARLLR